MILTKYHKYKREWK